MPRPLRIEYEDAWYHVMNRGANRQMIFINNPHRNLFYTMLGEIVDQFKVEIHAFCLMNNHYHLLIKTPFANLSKAMRHLDGIYTQRFNRAEGRDGPLFRGRYKAILVDSDNYLLQVSRYIHLNPVAAKICKNLSDFKWSSYLSYVNKRYSIEWLQTSYTLGQMKGADLRQAYSAFVLQGVDVDTRQFYSKRQLPSIYGNDGFIKSHLTNIGSKHVEDVLTDVNRTKPLPEKEIILSSVIKHFQLSRSDLHSSAQGKKNNGKMIALYLLRQLAHATHKEIAEMFDNIKPKSISVLIGRAKKLMIDDVSFSAHVESIINMIATC